MGRTLTPLLNAAILDMVREPGHQLFIYDVRSSSTTIGDIVREASLDPLSEATDFSGVNPSTVVEETAGNYTNQGIASSSVTVRIVDENGLLDPLLVLDDPLAAGRWFRKGNVVRLAEGDLRVPTSDWPITFTGEIIGQPGYVRDREGQSVLEFRALSRERHFLQYNNTSESFPAATTYRAMAESIAENDMGLDPDEIEFAQFGTTASSLAVTQFVDEPPLVSIAKLMFVDGFMPRFNGEGKLTQTTGTIGAAATRVYDDAGLIRRIERPFSDVEPATSVCVVGLEDTLTRIDQPKQDLRNTTITTGYFTQDEEIEIYWSDDRSVVADNVEFRVNRSVNAGITLLGGNEGFTLIPAPSDPLKPAVGSIGARIEITTGFTAGLIITITGAYIAASFIPDTVVSLIGGSTISVGRAIQAALLASILIIMTRLGRGDYTFAGSPLEYVYREIRACARAEDVGAFDLNEIVVENHLVSTQSLADALARDVLLRENAAQNPRRVSAIYDPALEVDDIFEVSGRRYLIERIRRNLGRGVGDVGLAEYQCVEVTPGVAP